MAIFAVTVLWLAAMAITYFMKNRPKVDVKKYKGEKALPLLGDAGDFVMRPVALIKEATEQCGNVFSIQILNVYNVWLRGNHLNKIYLDTREDVWSFVGGMGMFLNKIIDHGFWEHYKTHLASLNKYINLAATHEYITTVSVEEAQKAGAEWEQMQDFELFDTVSLLVIRIIVRSLMGQDFYEHNSRELYDLLQAMESDIGSIFSIVLPDWVPHPPARRMHKSKERFREIFLERLAERAAVERQDSRPLKDYVAFTLEDKQTAHLAHLLPSHHTLLMFASHTSTVSSISWSIVSLMRNPEMMKKVTDELRANPGVDDSVLIQAVVRETTRCYCGMKLLRLAREDVEIPEAGVSVPKGAMVSISPYLTHFEEENYECPNEWDPTRWIGEDGELLPVDNKSDGVRFIPFGGGSHRCPGEKLALIMVGRAVANLLRDYDVEWASAEVAKTTDFTNLNFDKVGAPWLRGGVRVRLTKV